MTTHLMLDIESLDTAVGAVVMSAALVRFSDEAHTTLNLSVPDQQTVGLSIGRLTYEWWGTQSPEAWRAATENPVPVLTALDHLSKWIAWASGGGDCLIWCHGATFDCPLLGEVYRRFGMATPWHFAAVRDTRTLYDLASVDVRQYAVPPPHIALNDAIGQTRAANAALAVLAGKRGSVAA